MKPFECMGNFAKASKGQTSNVTSWASPAWNPTSSVPFFWIQPAKSAKGWHMPNNVNTSIYLEWDLLGDIPKIFGTSVMPVASTIMFPEGQKILGSVLVCWDWWKMTWPDGRSKCGNIQQGVWIQRLFSKLLQVHNFMWCSWQVIMRCWAISLDCLRYFENKMQTQCCLVGVFCGISFIEFDAHVIFFPKVGTDYMSRIVILISHHFMLRI